jgi:hypothetical protein
MAGVAVQLERSAAFAEARADAAATRARYALARAESVASVAHVNRLRRVAAVHQSAAEHQLATAGLLRRHADIARAYAEPHGPAIHDGRHGLATTMVSDEPRLSGLIAEG